jgi:hypothetical protein
MKFNLSGMKLLYIVVCLSFLLVKPVTTKGKYIAPGVRLTPLTNDGRSLAAAWAYKGELIADRETINADGKDLCFVTVRIIDEEGNLCPQADNLVSFEIEGNGQVAAIGNGNPISHESYQAKFRKAFHGLCLLVIRSEQSPGKITIEASSEDLKPAEITISSK